MKSQLKLILELDRLDSDIIGIDQKLAEMPSIRQEMSEKTLQKKNIVEEKTKSLGDLEKTKRTKEVQVETSESRLNDFQGKLSQIKTNKEYQAALKEISDTKKANKVIEDEILGLMSQLEVLKKEKEESETFLQDVTITYQNREKELVEEEAILRQKREQFLKDKESLLPQIDVKVAQQYQKVRKARRDALSAIESGVCGGCNMKIPPQLYIEIQKSQSFHTCPSCFRILYLQEWKSEVAQKY